MFGTNKAAKGKAEESYTESFSANIIQNGTYLSGQIESAGNIRIDGKLDGKLTSKGKLVVGKTGYIIGDVACQNASIEGRIEGDVVVEELLFLKSTAFILGDITTQKIVVEEGAQFNGSCKMNSKSRAGLSTDSDSHVERKAI